MQLIPTNGEVLDLVHRAGGLHQGHFEYPSGLHSANYIQMALAMRRHEDATLLSVALSRLVRSNPEIRAMISKLSIVAPATGGLPVAYGVCEALRAHQVYWAESLKQGDPLRFRMFFELEPGEKVLLVDDIVRSGLRLSQLKQLVEEKGGEVVGIAVLIHDPTPEIANFGDIPFYQLARFNSEYSTAGAACELCKKGVPVTKVWV